MFAQKEVKMADMGIGELGMPNTIIKRKFRYTLQIDTDSWGIIPESFVKVASRPQLEIDELEIQFLNASTWIPGKGRWQPLNITYIDTTSKDMLPLYDWVASVYNFQKYADGTHLSQSERKGWNAQALISMYDGCGTVLEKWTLFGCFPQSINFGDLDYGSNDESTIDLTIRFDKVKIEGFCNQPVPTVNCVGCDS